MLDFTSSKTQSMSPPHPDRVRFGVFEADLRSGEIRKHGIKLKLHRQPFQVLAVLLEHRGEVVTREQLRARLWSADTFVAFDKGLDTAIHRLRNALGDSSNSPRFVETVPRKGYRFIAPVEELTNTRIGKKTAAQAQDRTVDKRFPRFLFLSIGSTGVTLAILIGLYAIRSEHRSAPQAAAHRISSLVVLPLENASGDASQEYLVDGVTDELTRDLSKIGGLRVISRTSAVQYKGNPESLPRVAQEFKVDAAIKGAVALSGNRVRITTQLLDLATNQQVWRRDYERDLGDLGSLGYDLAEAVAEQAQIPLSLEEQNRLVQGHPISPKAYERYLNGRYECDHWTEENLKKSVGSFKDVIRQEPDYAPAWAGLATAYGLLDLFHYSPHNVALKSSREAALKALELDDTLSEAYVSLASASLSEWSWSAAAQEIQRAIDLDPNNATAHQWRGYLLRAEGRYDESIVEMKTALELDPLTANKKQSLGATLYQAGHYDEALQLFRGIADPDANSERRHRWMAAIYEQKGLQRESIAEILKALRLSRKSELAAAVEQKYLAVGYGEARRAYLLGDLQLLQSQAKNPGSAVAIDVAGDYALLGNTGRAFHWLEKAFREHDESMMYLKVDDRLATLRLDPRFKNLVRRMGLPS
jgi:TolB-like protein/DNA-binding winged helix-turn-helix (wHTH) protein/Tfp pilus assembly protein PilF